MDIVVISDTHGLHRQLSIPPGEMIIHAGDITHIGDANEFADFIQWYNALDFKHKIFIAGNHDFFLEKMRSKARELIPSGIMYLENSAIEIEGITIFGSPVTPEYMEWAFMAKRGNEIRQYWNKIPVTTDILVTHTPPFGILDKMTDGLQVGCQDLRSRILDIKPRYSIFGHIHDAYGRHEENETVFINASSANAHYQIANDPVVLKY